MDILIYTGIFLAKLVEVSLSTVRIVLVGRGEKLKGTVIGFFEVLLWLVVTANVLSSVASDPFKILVYCAGFSCGIYLGMVIEDKLAIGTACIQAVVLPDGKGNLSQNLRQQGYGVTVMQGQGRDSVVEVLMIYVKRKSLPEATELIRSHNPNALITINDVRSLRNGFMLK